MVEFSAQEYLVRDPQGNVYGPAAARLLREWAAQGRIVPGMHIAPKETGEWVEVSVHPALAGCFAAPRASPAGGAESVTPAAAPTAVAGVGAGTPAMAAGPAVGTSQPIVARMRPVAGPSQPMAGPSPTVTGVRQNVPAVIAMIAGIVAMVGSPVGFVLPCICVGAPGVGLTALVAIGLGILGLLQIRENPRQYTGQGMAVAGLVLGIGAVLLFVLFTMGGALFTAHH
jgi:hypothetical protein